MSEKHTIYCFNNGGSDGWMHAVALGDDGNIIAGHICSHEDWMQHDLGITSDWKHDLYDAHFGAGNWQLEWVPTDQRTSHVKFNEVIALVNLIEKAT